MARILRALAFAASGIVGMGAREPQQRFVVVLPEGLTGWVCVNLGVKGAPPLPREGDTLIVRSRPGEVLKTSDTVKGYPAFSEAWFESDGKRRPLPADVYARRESIDSKTPIVRHCAFFGTQDQVDAAGEPPGSESSWQWPAISAEERQALVALYEATGGSHWLHRVGWLGPPGTECRWHGVECGSGAVAPVTGLELSENNLTGAIPEAVGRLENLEWLSVFGNHLSGRLPDPVIRRWLAGPVRVAAEATLLTGVSEIDFEWSVGCALCAWHRITLRADGSAVLFTRRCRDATPDDRTTFCEVKEGHIWSPDFAKLGWLIEKNGFFDLSADYSRSMTHQVLVTTRVTRGGKPHQVVNYADAGPFELWVVQNAIEGVAAPVLWEKTTRRPKCPRIESAQPPK